MFWGVQGVFQHVDGVTSAVSGYAGGTRIPRTMRRSVPASPAMPNPSVSHSTRGASATAASCKSTSRCARPDRTQLPRSRPRYAIPLNDLSGTPEQTGIASAYVAQLNQAHAFRAPVVTTIETGRAFYPAEAYHQDYLTRHPTNPYIVYNDLPEIRELQRLFPDLYRDGPVLVAAKQ